MIIHGDSIERMRLLPENLVDAIVTDPPYGIGFMGKEWDNFKPSAIEEGMEKDKRPKTGIASTRTSNIAGTYDTSISGSKKFQKWCEDWSREAFRVLKPGAFMLVSCSTRMYHRMTCGIEDAGFQIRDTIMWIYGSGFPKSLNIGKQIDKIQGNDREVIGEKVRGDVEKAKQNGTTFAAADANKNNKDIFGYGKEILTKGNSEWEGWGTALKPACEPIVVARKPLSEKSVASNCLKWGTGGINIEACRIPAGENDRQDYGRDKDIPYKTESNSLGNFKKNTSYKRPEAGRFPANIIFDEEAGEILGEPSRFFYCAKASKKERNYGCENLPTQRKSHMQTTNGTGTRSMKDGFPDTYVQNNHPTVKPINLMEYLVKLVSKEGATVLDPFLGSGTTAIACIKLKRKWIGIEREEDYIKIVHARIKPFMDNCSSFLNNTKVEE